MFHKDDLSNFLYPCSLQFKLPALERKFIQMKEERIHELTLSKVILLVFAIVQSLVMGLYAISYYIAGNMTYFWATVSDTMIGIFGLAIEFASHRFNHLRKLRGFPTAIGGFFLGLHFSSVYMDIPSVILEYFFLHMF